MKRFELIELPRFLILCIKVGTKFILVLASVQRQALDSLSVFSPVWRLDLCRCDRVYFLLFDSCMDCLLSKLPNVVIHRGSPRIISSLRRTLPSSISHCKAAWSI